MDYLDYQYSGMVPEAFIDPDFDVEMGFRVLVRWKCGCEFKGFHRNPATFRKHCPSHLDVRPDLIMVPVAPCSWQDSFEIPAAPAYEARLWPRGTFALKSPVGVRRMAKVREEMALALRTRRRFMGEQEFSELSRKIAVADSFLRTTTARKSAPRAVVPIKSA